MKREKKNGFINMMGRYYTPSTEEEGVTIEVIDIDRDDIITVSLSCELLGRLIVGSPRLECNVTHESRDKK